MKTSHSTCIFSMSLALTACGGVDGEGSASASKRFGPHIDLTRPTQIQLHEAAEVRFRAMVALNGADVGWSALDGPLGPTPGAGLDLMPSWEPERRIDPLPPTPIGDAPVLVPRPGSPSEILVPRFFGDDIELDSGAGGPRLDVPTLDPLPRNPSVLGFQGTLDELRKLSPPLIFDRLEIDALEIQAGAAEPIRIRAREVQVRGRVGRSPEWMCGAQTPELEIRASQTLTVDGSIDLSGSEYGDCPAPDGGAIALTAEQMHVFGPIVAAGVGPGRGGRIALTASERIVLGPDRMLFVGGGDRESRGELLIDTPEVRQVFFGAGPHLVLGIDQRVDGVARADDLGEALAACAEELGRDALGATFYLDATTDAPLRVEVPEALRLVAVDREGCRPIDLGSARGDEDAWMLEVDDPANIHFGIIPPEGEDEFAYQFRVQVVRR